MEDLKMYPDWRQAVEDFVAGNPKPGDVITKEWKHRHFGITPPTYGNLETWQTYELRMLNAFNGFSSTLLEEHQIHLKADRKGGHIVLAPKEQTQAAIDDCNCGIKKALKKSKNRLEHVATGELSAEERKEHTDAQVRLSMAASMFKKVRRITLS